MAKTEVTMTSRVMTRPNRAPLFGRADGFTLVELLLVLALIVLLGTMAAPSLSGALAKARINSAAEELATAWGQARLEAIRSGEPIAFRCQLGTSNYFVGPLSAVMQQAGQPSDKELSSVTFKQISFGEPEDMPPADPGVVAILVFQADGATRDAYAVIESENGALRRIVLEGLTCAAEIETISASTLNGGGR